MHIVPLMPLGGRAVCPFRPHLSGLDVYRDLRPDDDRPVEVQLAGGTWVGGWLEAYRKGDGVWSGFVRYFHGAS